MTAFNIKFRSISFVVLGFVVALFFINPIILFAQETEQTYYDKKGNISSKEKVNKDGEVIEVTTYYKSGGIKNFIPYEKEEATGIVKVYNRKGKLVSETEYLNGHPDGIQKIYFRRSTFIKTFRNGKEKKVFQVIEYYSNGNVKNKYYNKFFEGYGPFEANYKNGNPKIRGNFVGLKRDGEWRFYNKDGTLRKVKVYREKFVFSPRHHII